VTGDNLSLYRRVRAAYLSSVIMIMSSKLQQMSLVIAINSVFKKRFIQVERSLTVLNWAKFFWESLFHCKKLFYREKKNIALYSSAHTLCGVKVGAKLRC